MTIRIRVSQTAGNVQLAVRDLPDGSGPRLSAAWGDADAALTFMLGVLREETLSRNVQTSIAGESAARLAAIIAEEAAFATDFPA